MCHEFDHAIGAIIKPSFQLIFGAGRSFADLNNRPDKPMGTMMESVHFHHVCCTWWNRQHNSDTPAERFLKRAVNLFCMLEPKDQRD